MKADFYALDKLTLQEIERLFGQGSNPSDQGALPFIPVTKHTGRVYDSVPGAVFYELEDLDPRYAITAEFVQSRRILKAPLSTRDDFVLPPVVATLPA